MNIIVSKDKRVPVPLREHYNYEIWSIDEFYERASRDEGLVFDEDEGLYMNIAVLDFDLYENLATFSEEIKIIYYKFSDQDFRLSFNMKDEIVVYEDVIEKESTNLSSEDNFIVEEISEDEFKELEEKSTEKDNIEEDNIEDEDLFEEEKSEEEVIEKTSEETKEIQYEVEEVNSSIEESVEVDSELSVVSVQVDLSKEKPEDLDTLFKQSGNDSLNGDKEPAKIYLFGSLKGGSGKSTTCIMSVHNFAKNNPNLKVAVLDLDLSDGQVGSFIFKANPTLKNYYERYQSNEVGMSEYEKEAIFKSVAIKSDRFTSNVDFYIPPVVEDDALSKDLKFWKLVLEQLMKYYDVVFIDSGTEYITKPVITNAYKLAHKLILFSNTTPNSVQSLRKQLLVLGGKIKNPTFKESEKLLEKVNIVITRASDDIEIVNLALGYLKPYARVAAVFGNLEKLIEGIQWYKRFNLIYDFPQVVKLLDRILT